MIDSDRVRRHVEQIARASRPTGSTELVAARHYVTGALTSAGWVVTPDPFCTEDDAGRSLSGINLIATHPDHPVTDKPRFSLGAHLDSRENSPGADDNGSAVAALLEVARLLPELWPAAAPLDLELVVYDLEENGMLGGAYRAAQMRAKQVDLRGMVSLEMLGFCNHAPRSQTLPHALIGKYPDVGNFIAVIGNQNSSRLINEFRCGLQQVPALPVETLQVPENGNLLQATRLSDHSPFWDEGFAALMITDTSFLRNPHYHQASDTPETLDYSFLAKVTTGVLHSVRRILVEGL